MDSITQVVLGAAVGEAVLGKKVGNKALLWGAIGGTIPDLDAVVGLFLDTVTRVEIHRGFSHSLVFAVLLSPILAWLLAKLYRKKNEANWMGWTQLMFWSIFTHPLLDIFTTWGTQFLWPLEWRIAVKSIFVIDPIYTLPFLLCVTSVLFFKRTNPKRGKINRIGLIVSSAYLLYTVLIKIHIDSVFADSLAKQSIDYKRFDSRPTPFNSILWTTNIEREDEFLISYYSLFDSSKELKYYNFPKNTNLIKPYRNNPKLERLLSLTNGYYTLEKSENGIVLNDLRFGLTEGFDNGKGVFTFSYEIINKGNELSIERNINSMDGAKEAVGKLWDRLLGV